MKWLRIWDYQAAQNNDVILANSDTTASRIQKYYRRNSQVVYPPIETKRFAKKLDAITKSEYFNTEKYYIILSALTEFKKLDVAISAFKNISSANLLIIWAWEYRKNLEAFCDHNKNIKFTWAQYGDDLVSLVQNSSGLIFPGEEDFGIVPIEVMAAGKPVFALRKWWLTETVIDWKTGSFFDSPEWDDFIEKFHDFHALNIWWHYSSIECKNQAAKYDSEVFHKKILALTT